MEIVKVLEFKTLRSGYRIRNGQSIVVLGKVDKLSYDFEKVGNLYYIKFPDGFIMKAKEEELLYVSYSTFCTY